MNRDGLRRRPTFEQAANLIRKDIPIKVPISREKLLRETIQMTQFDTSLLENSLQLNQQQNLKQQTIANIIQQRAQHDPGINFREVQAETYSAGSDFDFTAVRPGFLPSRAASFASLPDLGSARGSNLIGSMHMQDPVRHHMGGRNQDRLVSHETLSVSSSGSRADPNIRGGLVPDAIGEAQKLLDHLKGNRMMPDQVPAIKANLEQMMKQK